MEFRSLRVLSSTQMRKFNLFTRLLLRTIDGLYGNLPTVSRQPRMTTNLIRVRLYNTQFVRRFLHSHVRRANILRLGNSGTNNFIYIPTRNFHPLQGRIRVISKLLFLARRFFFFFVRGTDERTVVAVVEAAPPVLPESVLETILVPGATGATDEVPAEPSPTVVPTRGEIPQIIYSSLDFTSAFLQLSVGRHAAPPVVVRIFE